MEVKRKKQRQRTGHARTKTGKGNRREEREEKKIEKKKERREKG